MKQQWNIFLENEVTKNHSNESFLLISLERKKMQENVFASLITSPQKHG